MAAPTAPSTDPRLFGIIGHPLGHSLSPLIHNTGFRTAGINAVYLRWPITPDRLADFVQAARLLDIQGCSVTIPHKTAIIPLLDGITPLAEQVGAVNTLYRDGTRLLGDNTDIAGFRSPLGNLAGQTALLLGAGGAARAAAAGLQHLSPARTFIATPSDRSHMPLASQFGLTPVPWSHRHEVAAHLVINATPMGMLGEHQDETPYDFAAAPIPNDGLPLSAYDIIYAPPATRFLIEAAAAGRQTITGVRMFYGQAQAQFLRWTGRRLPETARQALAGAIPASAPSSHTPSGAAEHASISHACPADGPSPERQ